MILDEIFLIINCNYCNNVLFVSYPLKGVLPRHQEVLVFEEQGLCDDVFMASQPVQPTLIDDVPHDHIRVLKKEAKGNNMLRTRRDQYARKPTNLDTQRRICPLIMTKPIYLLLILTSIPLR